MKKTKTQKGITLIALIITIIILLILAVVTINSVKDGGIITHAQKAASDYTIAQEKEKMNLALSEWQIQKNTPSNTKTFKEVIENALYETATVSGEDNGPLTITMNATGNKYKVTVDGEITKLREGSLLEKYILGADLTGRLITDIMNTETFKFVDDITTKGIDETQTIGAEFISVAEESNGLIMYFKSQDITYKFILNLDLGTTDADYGVVQLYIAEEESRVGKTVRYDNKLWRILYDDDINGLQMVSEESLKYNGEDFLLGATDSLVSNWNELIDVADLNKDGVLNNLEKNVYSYNNAITTLNTACENIVTPSSNILDVRCVGSNPINKNAENTTLYTSENLAKWPINNEMYPAGIGNGIGKSEDFNYVSDFERMVVLEINKGDYWMASRAIEEDQYWKEVYMYIKWGSEEGVAKNEYWIYGIGDDVVYGGNYGGGPGLRPVITLKSDIQFSGSGTEADPYTF